MPAHTRVSHPKKWLILALVLAAECMDLLDGTIVNAAAPTIHADLHAGSAALQWIIGPQLVMGIGIGILSSSSERPDQLSICQERGLSPKKSPPPDSNRKPLDYKSSALPIELGGRGPAQCRMRTYSLARPDARNHYCWRHR